MNVHSGLQLNEGTGVLSTTSKTSLECSCPMLWSAISFRSSSEAFVNFRPELMCVVILIRAAATWS